MSKVLIITGSRKGIGRYLSEYYLAKGLIVCGFSRGESELTHENYHHYAVDVADEINVIKSIKSIKKQFGKIDYLLNNAGIASMNPVLLTPVSTVDNIMRTNFLGTFIFSREVSKIMISKRFGRIVNFSSVAVPLDLEGESIYAASKAAIESFTNILAKELGPLGITCNSLGSSPIKTDLIKNVPKDKMDALISLQAIPEFSNLEDISNITDFFLQDSSKMITGQTIYLAGVN